MSGKPRRPVLRASNRPFLIAAIVGSLALAGLMYEAPIGTGRNFAFVLALVDALVFCVLLFVNVRYGRKTT